MSTENLPQSPEQQPRKPRVAVVFGGRSSEHGISVVTAGAVLRAIDRTKYDVLPIGITTDGRWALTADEPERMAITDRRTPSVEELAESRRGRRRALRRPGATAKSSTASPASVPKALGEVDVVFPVLHGPYGEDGTLQGLLELSGVPYVGSGVLASAVGQDKEYMKRVFTSFGLPVGPYVVIRPREWERDRAAARKKIVDFAGEHGWPLFVKPARAGSSIGITKVDDLAGLDEAIEEAQRHDPKIIVEALLRGREIECGVLEFEDGPRASVPAEIPPRHSHDFYDFEAKYIDSASGIVPAPLDRRSRPPRCSGSRSRPSTRPPARAWSARTSSSPRTASSSSTRSTRCRASRRSPCTRGCGRRAASSYPELVDRLIQAALRRSTGLR